jgi:hypothetical protein
MKLTREQARQMDFERQKPFFKNVLKNSGESKLYYTLRHKFSEGVIFDMPIKDFVEMLKQELEQEKMLKNKSKSY